MAIGTSVVATLLGGTIVAAMGVLGTWLGGRLLGKAAFKKSTDEGWAKLTESLQHERKTLDTMVHDLREEMKAERIAAVAEHAALRGQISNLTQVIISLENVLRENGIPIPPRPYVAPVALQVLS